MSLSKLSSNLVQPLDGQRAHQFDEDSVLAVQTAYAAERPLLVRGEPGVGKSQLAEAVAAATNRRFIPFVVDSNTDSRDLLWRFDAVKRLADAQLVGALKTRSKTVENEDGEDCDPIGLSKESLAERNYIIPGPLWEGFDWKGAEDQKSSLNIEKGNTESDRPAKDGNAQELDGCVVLIDEIDKGETEVPNGLLQALGSGEFTPQGFPRPVVMKEPRPLVIITTNEERALPDAFMRRCIVHYIDLPDASQEDLEKHLTQRGRVHFPSLDEEVLSTAARQLFEDRADAKQRQLRPFPGQAEYLDLLRAVSKQESKKDHQLALLTRIAKFALNKNRGRS